VRRALRGAPGIQVAVTGMGQAAAMRAAAEWAPRARAVVVCGVAGGTGGVAGAGDVVVASGLLVDGVVHGGLVGPEVPGAVLGVVASQAGVVDTAAARAALRDAGAVAVETEAAAWAQACARLGVPLAVVRGVLDTPEQPLELAAGMVRDGARGPGFRGVGGAVLRPGAWPALVRLGRRAGDVERRVAEAAVRVARGMAAG
jgi:nucleoside phosphorylase